MARRKNTAGRKGLQGQKWLNTSLTENVNSLTTTVTALELDAQSCLLATSHEFDIPDDDNSLVGDPGTSVETSNPIHQM